MENSEQIKKLELRNCEIIQKYMALQTKHQELFFNYQEKIKENKKLSDEVEELKRKIRKSELLPANEIIAKENKRLVAKVNQLKRNSTPVIVTPKKSSVKPKIDCNLKSPNKEFEVEELIRHKGRKGNRQYLVHWKKFSSEYDSWEHEKNLFCPKILSEYLKKNCLA